MTDQEIVETLKRCAAGTCINCVANNGTANCITRLEKAAIELIERQQSEIESLNKRISEQEHALFKQQEYTAELQDALETKCDDCNNIQLTYAEYLKVIKQVKSEAYKEFAEKAAIALANAYSPEYAHWIDDTLNNLLKELVGDQK